MAQTGYTPILIYASGTASNVPLAANLTSSASGAELALNYADGKLYYKNSSGVVTLLASSGGSPAGGSTTQIQYNNGGVLGGVSGFTFSSNNLSLTPSGYTVLGGGSGEAGRITANKNLLMGTTTDFSTTTVAGGTAVTGYGIYPLSVVGLTNTTVFSALNINAPTFAGDNGATAKSYYGLYSATNIKNDATGGTTAFVNGYGGTFASYVESSAATARVQVLGVAAQATRSNANDLSSYASNIVTGLQVTSNTQTTLPSTASTGTLYGVTATTNLLSGSGNNQAAFVATATVGNNASSPAITTSTIRQFYGATLTIGAATSLGTATVTQTYGAQLNGPTVAATGSLATHTALWLGAATVTGTLTTRYGVYQNDAVASNYFAGNVGIGTTAPSTTLDIVGNSTFQGDVNITSATPSLLFSVPSGGLDSRIYNDGSGNLIFGNGTNSGTPTERMRLDSSGNLGIGTSSPTQKLTVAGNAALTGKITTTANTDALVLGSGTGTSTRVNMYFNGTNASGSARVNYIGTNISGTAGNLEFYNNITGLIGTWDLSGNLGLSVTPSAWQSDSIALDIGAYTSLSNVLGYQATISNNAYYNAGYKYRTSGYVASAFAQANGAFYWQQTSTSGTAGAAIAFTQAMTLNASGILSLYTTSAYQRVTIGGIGGAVSTAPAITFYDTNSLASRTWCIANGISATGVDQLGVLSFNQGSGSYTADPLSAGTERMRLDSSGNMQVRTGAVVVWAPTPASISTTATLTNANIQAQIINTTGTTYTVTMPLGTTMETLVTWSAVDLGYDFTVINTASGTITMAVNTGVTSLGALTIATGTSAQFRVRRTAANTFVLYRMR